MDELQLLSKLRELNFHIVRAARHSWKKVKTPHTHQKIFQLKDSIRATLMTSPSFFFLKPDSANLSVILRDPARFS
jgi:hypothetical protein